MNRWPKLAFGHICIEQFLHPNGSYSVYIVQRNDGTYSTYEEELTYGRGEFVWHPTGLSTSIYESREQAYRELLATNSWASDVQSVSNK